MDKVNASFSPIYMKLDNPNPQAKRYSANQVDMNDLYSKEELDAMIARFGCLHPVSPFGTEKCVFDTIFIPDNESVVINNRNMTNDTVEVYKDGHAISVGSWHRKGLDGDYSDIITDVKSRISQKEAKGEEKLNSQMDSLAKLGKSQVAVK